MDWGAQSLSKRDAMTFKRSIEITDLNPHLLYNLKMFLLLQEWPTSRSYSKRQRISFFFLRSCPGDIITQEQREAEEFFKLWPK